ncbi:MAG: hypothetical protein ABIS15_00980 [Gemmatimonadaceae bacterium]
MEKWVGLRLSATLKNDLLALRAGTRYTSGIMTIESNGRVISALWRRTIYFLAAAQLLLAIGPMMEGQLGANADSHVEAGGTSAHHAHNAADCVACVARGLLARASHSGQPAIQTLQSVLPGLSERDEHLDFLRGSNSRSRAPPLRQA